MTDTYEYIYSFTLKPQELNAFIDKLVIESPAYLLLEKITAIKFLIFKSDTEDFAAWSGGRIFTSTREVKWRKLENSFRLVLITPENNLEGADTQLTLPGNYDAGIINPGKIFSVFLWGIEAASKNKYLSNNFKDNEFIERSIPVRLCYPAATPLQPGSRLSLGIQPYYDEEGVMRFYRFTSLQEVKADECG